MAQALGELIFLLGIKAGSAVAFYTGGGYFTQSQNDCNLCPEEFLEQAEADYKNGGPGSLLNSISNSQRAIRCAIDQAVDFLGFSPRQMSLSKKVEILSYIGFLTPSILRRVSDARNLLEHEYHPPSPERIEEALELAGLFIEATNRNLDQIGNGFTLGNKGEQLPGSLCSFRNEVSVSWSTDAAYTIYGYRNRRDEFDQPKTCMRRFNLPFSDPLYLPLMRLGIVLEKERPEKTARALVQFFDALKLG